MGTARRHWAFTVAPLAVGALLLSACGGGAGQGGGSNVQVREMTGNDINPQPADQLKDGGNLNLPLVQWPQQWNYNQVQGVGVDLALVSRALIPEVFLSEADGTVRPNPDVLTEWKLLSTEPQVIQFTINPKARWSDGTPITYQDFVATWKARNGTDTAYQPASTAGWQDVSSVERGADDRDVRITFAKVYAEWQGLLQFLYPASHYATPEQFNEDWVGQLPVTAGPFKVKSMDNTAKVLVLERDPNWWGEKPKLDTITFKTVPASAQPQAFQAGDIDAVDIGPDVATFQTIQQVPNAVIRKALAPDWRVLNFSARPGTPLADVAVRTALFKGIDRTALGKAVLGPIVPDVRPLNNHIFVEGQKGYQDNGAPYDFDPQQAQAELDAAGWKLAEGNPIRAKDGTPLRITLTIPSGIPTSSNEAQIFQQQLKNIGVDLQISTVDLNAWQTQYLQTGNFELLNMAWEGTPFPISSVTSIYTFDPGNVNQNYGRIPDTTGINELFRQANEELDEAKRIELANKIDQAAWQEGFSLPLYQRPDAWGVRKDLANYGAFGFAEVDFTKVGFTR
ncbi:ABC transporter family substrate-binding protein [Goodfellowiella coeruleoviolacea]|uniref:ABC transporter family substrate-binding protein n=1 Tax=Goodfellowiella coeruleoviolacea TaxID=334858 RepID=UPI000A6F0E44|nr:ABC transporter family substrate-binding protein [Goodfellowiella coeruleoviolacea]